MSLFLDTIKNRVLIGDGAMGTMLVKRGLGQGDNPELWMLSHPQEIKNIHLEYLQAGAQVIQTNTFGANRFKLAEYGAASRVKEINLMAAQLARDVVGNTAFVAGIVGPTGHFPAPLGNVEWSELVTVFAEQCQALAAGGADFLFLETFSDLGEIRAALFAAKNYTSLPVACSLTYTAGRTLTGTSPAIAAAVLTSLGADLLGANCSTGPAELLAVMQEYRNSTSLPLLVEPNAGMPVLIDGNPVYNETPQNMASFVEPFRQSGVSLIGSCCGSTPEHTKAMAAALKTTKPVLTVAEKTKTTLASRSKLIVLGTAELPLIIGERINPTARKSIAQAYRENNWDSIAQEGLRQVEAGAALLDLNVGVPGLEEKVLLPKGVRTLQMSLDVPLVLDCTQPEALEQGLREYQGKALINSVNGEEKSLQAILPLAKKYGAAVLGLCLDERGIPDKAEYRLEIARKIVNRALNYGIAKEDILIDCLVLTAAASPALTRETIRSIALVKEHLGVATVLGLSNVSHGLPQRSWLNSAFLALALGAGLDAAIASPFDNRVKETIAAAALLTGRDTNAANYLVQAGKQPAAALAAPTTTVPASSLQTLGDLILKGQPELIIPLLKELTAKHDLLTIINQGIIPPLEKVGELFACGEVFLPQLIMSGDAAKKAFTYLKESFPDRPIEQKGTIVMGTVRGDIHDIGKNITAALIENHGYKVIDLGKNVSGEEFLASAKKEKAQIVGLSALMTTTMIEMEPIIKLLKKENPSLKVIVGGAVITKEYARQIGADGYGKDAVQAVKLVQSLLEQ